MANDPERNRQPGELTFSEVADAMGITVGTLRTRRNRGSGCPPFIRRGRHYYVSRDVYHAWQAARVAEAEAALAQVRADQAVALRLLLDAATGSRERADRITATIGGTAPDGA